MIQHGAHGGLALVVLEGGGHAQVVAAAFERKHRGHSTGALGKGLYAWAIAIEQFAVQTQQRLAIPGIQRQVTLQAARQTVRQKLGALAQVLVVGFDEAHQHLHAVLHFGMHFGFHGFAHPPCNPQHQQSQNGRYP